MNDTHFSPDDPKLTAYALGELEGDERAAVEAALRLDPVARAAVAETRAFAAQLKSALAAEAAAPAASGSYERERVDERVDDPPLAHARSYDSNSRRRGVIGKLLQFPQFYYVAGGLAAACFAIIAALHSPPPMPPRRQYVEIPLAPRESAIPAGALETEAVPA